VRWFIFAIFLFGMISSLVWYEAATRERKMVSGLLAILALALVLLLGNTML
jgi:type II secretory pathway component PulM